MSEQEQEPAMAPEPPQEPQTPDETPGLEPDEPEEPEQPEEPAAPPEPEQPEGMSEKQMEATRRKLDAENARHRGRISDLIGEEALLLVPCELCNGFADGYRFPVEPPPDVIEAVRVAIGLPDLSNYQQASDAHKCEDCNGQGVVLSGSLIAENAVIKCLPCNGSGFIPTGARREAAQAFAPANGTTPQPLPEGLHPDDPAVAELRARGFSVFPPVTLPAAQ